jgi:hypothetical protein
MPKHGRLSLGLLIAFIGSVATVAEAGFFTLAFSTSLQPLAAKTSTPARAESMTTAVPAPVYHVLPPREPVVSRQDQFMPSLPLPLVAWGLFRRLRRRLRIRRAAALKQAKSHPERWAT